MTAQQCFMKQSCTSFPQSSRFVVSARVPSIRPWLRSPSPVPRSRPALNAASPTKGKKGLNIDRDGAPVVANDDKASIDSFDFDSVLQRDLIANGPRSTRRTKIICTIGPKSCSSEMLEMLAEAGMNCARLNMTHETHEWHAAVIQRIRELNQKRGYSVAIMLDTEGSEVHLAQCEPLNAEEGLEVALTIRHMDSYPPNTFRVNYEGFVDDVKVGDMVVVDGGMLTMEVSSIEGPDVKCTVVDPGLLLSRANITLRDRQGRLIRGKNANLPVITAKDWLDIDFAISQGVDFLAISYVKSADVLANVKSYIDSRRSQDQSPIGVVAKIESSDALPNIESIARSADTVMIARGDLGAQIPLEQVPAVQQEITMVCQALGTPVIVASHLLQSMIQYPTPTRAEVADVAEVVRQKADALMLSGESAMGSYPEKAMDVLRAVAIRTEEWCRQESVQFDGSELPHISDNIEGRIQEEICQAAASMADKLKVKAICVFTRRGTTASMLSRCRPDCPIFAFTDANDVRRKANLRWGVMPFRFDFVSDVEVNVQLAFTFLKARGLAADGDHVVLVSDLKPTPDEAVRSIQVRQIKYPLQDAQSDEPTWERGPTQEPMLGAPFPSPAAEDAAPFCRL
eukprot:CAMPEP_0177625964 /NCGR_PEP_ID=MMETSP0419_2-20121207/30392_1 /TAXON_ID=582737 /ORGANISM="Tetraselmis sp., Strain GSL018" /LENGTH=626 /DNA_ID=CAMNT_0019126969 /DNA_START=8 /DNA_END=1889 /DNA_ORIENTATION=-